MTNSLLPKDPVLSLCPGRLDWLRRERRKPREIRVKGQGNSGRLEGYEV